MASAVLSSSTASLIELYASQKVSGNLLVIGPKANKHAWKLSCDFSRPGNKSKRPLLEISICVQGNRAQGQIRIKERRSHNKSSTAQPSGQTTQVFETERGETTIDILAADSR